MEEELILINFLLLFLNTMDKQIIPKDIAPYNKDRSLRN